MMGSRQHVVRGVHLRVMLFYVLMGTVSLTSASASRILDYDSYVLAGERQEQCPVSYSRRVALFASAATTMFHDRIPHAATMTVIGGKNKFRKGRQKRRWAAASRMTHVPSNAVNDEEQVASSGSNSSVDYNIISETCAGSHGLEVQQDNSDVNIRGLPVYHVTVINTCLDCSVAQIHIACGAWASATEVNPKIFRRVADNDCVVNDGRPITSQSVVYFEYTNSFPYPMNVRSATPSCS